ncbi:hypothetical protein R3I46_004669 [Salmonella enterica]|nr:hypothetical protein [Salmonella enterica]
MNNKNEVFEYLIDQLRQQVNSNPYKQQCEDLAHEVLSLKNQLRDASAALRACREMMKLRTDRIRIEREKLRDALVLVAELQKELENTGNEYRRAVDYALSDAPEQSGCRKNDTQGSRWIEWRGGACPVRRGELVDVIYRDGETLYGLPADKIHHTAKDASSAFWRHNGGPADIVRYRKALHQ